MTEPEVSLYIALYYIRNNLTKENVKVSIDGAHVKTGKTIHFDIAKFMKENQCDKCDCVFDKWQGEYLVDGYKPKIIITSKPGEGDVVIKHIDGTVLYIESKKIRKSKSSNEYPAMREAIGQLMTGCTFEKETIPIVAVPYTAKSYELAMRWSKYEQIKNVGIKFILVNNNESIKII